MLAGLTYAQIGAILVAGSLVLLWMRIFIRLRAVAVFTGLCLLGDSLLVRLLVDLTRFLATVFGDLFAKIFGASVAGGLGLLVIGIVIYDLHPKGGGATRRTYWFAVLAAGIVIAGLAGFKVLNEIPSGLHTGISTVTGG